MRPKTGTAPTTATLAHSLSVVRACTRPAHTRPENERPGNERPGNELRRRRIGAGPVLGSARHVRVPTAAAAGAVAAAGPP